MANNFQNGPGGRLQKEEKSVNFGFMRPEVSPLNQQQFMQVARGETTPQQTGVNSPVVFGQKPGSIGEKIGQALMLGKKPYPGQGFQFTPSETAKQTAIDLATGEAIGAGVKAAAPYVKPAMNKAAQYIKNNRLFNKFKSEIDWGKWNSEIPINKSLMKEYNAIEQTSKANNTWMKNPDGSAFQGTPEQFVQQNSENFKKAFGNSKLLNPDGSPTIQYHGSAKKFDSFDPSMFQLGDAGYSGKGIYTTPSKEVANSYATSSAKFHSGDIKPTVYELYGQANNPISSSQLIKEGANRDLFNFHRDKNWQGDLSPYESLRDFDAAISDQLPNVQNIRPWYDAREVVFPTNTQLKSAVGNNGMFDMTNPNIFKAIAPLAIGAGVLQKNKGK